MRGFFQGQRGFGLLEVLVAVAILGLIGTVLMQALSSNSRATKILDEQVVASNLIGNYFEAIFDSPYALTYPKAGDDVSIPFQYSVAVNTKCSSDGTTFNDCTANETETLQKITITVSQGGKAILSLCTYRSDE